MRILVTGGLGVNGSWVTRKLLERGHQPVVLENRPDFSLTREIEGQFPVVTGDVTDLGSVVQPLMEHKVQRIVHMAALMPDQAQDDPARGFHVNAAGAVNVFEAARAAGVERVIFTSSKAAYGEVSGEHGHPSYVPLNETDPCDPVMVYDVCKVAAEGMGRNYQSRYGIQFAALRFGTIFGPGKLVRHGSVSLLSQLVENAVAGVPSRVDRGGDQRDDMIYVGDVAEAIVLAVLADRLTYPVYNIGRGIGSTLHDFADAVRENVPGARIRIGPGLDFLQRGVNTYSVFDISRAREDLGYTPRFSLADGVRDYIAVMQRLGLQPQVTA